VVAAVVTPTAAVDSASTVLQLITVDSALVPVTPSLVVVSVVEMSSTVNWSPRLMSVLSSPCPVWSAAAAEGVIVQGRLDSVAGDELGSAVGVRLKS